MLDLSPTIVRPIVVGVDGSAASISALRWAAARAASTGERVRAVTVATRPFAVSTALDGVGHAWEPDIEDAHAVLARSIERAIHDPAQRATIERRVAFGTVSRRLLDEAENASMLVVGKASGSLGRVLGIAQRLTDRATCPVAVIPAGADLLTRPSQPAGNPGPASTEADRRPALAGVGG